MAPKARIQAKIFFKFHVMVTNNLNINSVNFFDSAMILKYGPFPYKGITPNMERLMEVTHIVQMDSINLPNQHLTVSVSGSSI